MSFADYVLPDTPANRARGVVGCIQRSTGEIDCPGAGGGGKTIYIPPKPRGPSPQELEEMREMALHELNERGIDAYDAHDYLMAIHYFELALEYDPHNPSLIDNLKAAEDGLRAEEQRRREAIRQAEALREQRRREAMKRAKDAAKEKYVGPTIPNYLSSVDTALGIVSVKPYLFILHPSPYVRKEANKQLAEETMKKIAAAAATFVLNEKLKQRSPEPFPGDTEAEKAAKRAEAERHSREVNDLKLKAHKEARESAQSLDDSVLKRDGNIHLTPGPAMSQLIEASISGIH